MHAYAFCVGVGGCCVSGELGLAGWSLGSLCVVLLVCCSLVVVLCFVVVSSSLFSAGSFPFLCGVV